MVMHHIHRLPFIDSGPTLWINRTKIKVEPKDDEYEQKLRRLPYAHWSNILLEY